jgi:undecaprenyl diphosphate synthase
MADKQLKSQVDVGSLPQKIPNCVGIIMDGNRRWAKEKGLPTLEGHRCGYQKLKHLLVWAKEAGVGHVIVYAFSTENWNRTKAEVNYLMNLCRVMVSDILRSAKKNKIRVRFLGQRERLPADIQKGINKVEQETERYDGFQFGVALSYGGRAEIVSAIKSLKPRDIQNLTEESFSRILWTRDFPDPDMVIRTSGEKRLSGFLPWQSVYSELFFTETYWPAFTRQEFYKILCEFSLRERRRGK